MNAGFVVQGTLFFVGAVLVARTAGHDGTRWFTGFAAANAVGNVVVASVPSGTSGVAWVHVGGAVLAIVGGNAAILAGARTVLAGAHYRAASITLAVIGLIGFALVAAGTVTATTVVLPGAVWERAGVYTIIGWQVLSAVELLARRR